MELKITEFQIETLHKWLGYYENNNQKSASATGAYAGIKYVLQELQIFYNIATRKDNIEVIAPSETIAHLVNYMNKNSIDAQWNLGVSSGICWTLELLGILDSNYAGLKD